MVENCVRLYFSPFYKVMLKISSFWRGFIQPTKLDSKYTSEEENSRWPLLPIITTLSRDFDKYLDFK